MQGYIQPTEVELLEGRPVPKVSPKRTHALVQGTALVLLRQCAGAAGDVGTEWRFQLTDTTELVPDVAFVARERLLTLTPQDREEPPFAPDVAVEVRSPSNREADIVWKTHAYLRHGAVLVLDVDPARRTLVAHAAGGVRHYDADATFIHEAAPWLTFDVRELFAGL